MLTDDDRPVYRERVKARSITIIADQGRGKAITAAASRLCGLFILFLGQACIDYVCTLPTGNHSQLVIVGVIIRIAVYTTVSSTGISMIVAEYFILVF